MNSSENLKGYGHSEVVFRVDDFIFARYLSNSNDDIDFPFNTAK